MKVFVQYQHFRYKKNGRLHRYYRGDPNFKPQANGGFTVCSINFDGILGTGVAVCQPEDCYCYKEGRSIAHSNALKDVANAIRAKQLA